MAYNLKYNFKWTDTGGANREFEIYEDGFAGTSESIPYSNASPMSVRMRGDQENTDNIINGQEFTFEIVVSDPADRHKFDPLFESDFQDFYGQYKKNGTVINKGWLKPENLEKDAENPQPRITLSFTDGLADLKDIEFKNDDGSFKRGEQSMIQTLKDALSKMGSTIADRDFRILSNFYEFNEMTVDSESFPDDSWIRVSDIDLRRFIKHEGGKAKADDCYTVIEKVLFDFNVKLKVENDQYWLTDYYESAYADANLTNGKTYVHKILWSDLTATGHSREKISNIVDLTGKQYRRGGNLTKLQPLKGYDLTYKNKYLGSIPDASLNDWNNWIIVGDVSNSIDADGIITLGFNSHDYSCYLESPEFSVTQETSYEYIKIIFDHIFHQFVSGSIGNVQFFAEMDNPILGAREAQNQSIGDSWDEYFSSNVEALRVTHSPSTNPDTYQLRIRFAVNPHTLTSASVEVKLTSPEVRKVVAAESVGEGSGSVNLDKNFIITQANGQGIPEIETVFGDAENTFDLGKIEINGNLTSVWNHLKNKQIPLLEQTLRHKINQRQSYADITRFQYLDTDDDISPEKALKIGSNYYEIIGFDKEYRQGNVTLHVRQIFITDVTYSLAESRLASSDGDPTTGSYTETFTSGGGGDDGSDPIFQTDPIYMEDDFWFDSQNNFNFNNVSTDRTLFSLYNDDLGGTSNFLASFDYDFTNDAFKINQANLDLSGNDITNINNFGGGGSEIGVDDDLNLGGTSSLTNINELDFGGTTVNEISTTIDGTSTDNQLATAAAINDLVTNWSLEDARGVDNTFQGQVNWSLGADTTKAVNITGGGETLDIYPYGIELSRATSYIRPTSQDTKTLGIGRNAGNQRWSVINLEAVDVNIPAGAFSLATGTSVNEIVTTIDGTSTDDQLPTAAAVNDRISGWGLEDARNASATFSGAWSFDAGYTIDWGGGEIVNITILEALGNANQLSLGNLSGSNIAMLVEDGSGGTNISTEWESTSGNFRIHQRAYKNGHLNYTNLNNQSLDAQYKLMPDGTVIFKGAISTWDSNGVAQDTIPNEARPPEDLTFFVNQRGSTTGYTLTFHSDGTISNEEGAEFPPTDLNLGVVRYDLN